jgi:hypothetical protein
MTNSALVELKTGLESSLHPYRLKSKKKAIEQHKAENKFFIKPPIS